MIRLRYTFFPTVYYFPPMIIIATMSMFSGVISAKLFHEDKSRPMTQLIRRITALISLRCVSITSSTNQRDDRRTEIVTEKQHGTLRTVDISMYSESSFDDENDENYDEDNPEDFDYHD